MDLDLDLDLELDLLHATHLRQHPVWLDESLIGAVEARLLGKRQCRAGSDDCTSQGRPTRRQIGREIGCKRQETTAT
ncbi:MAG: hypothetical protein V1750_03080 [Acidobacteriota bacterium]